MKGNLRIKTSSSPIKKITKTYETSVSIIVIEKCEKCSKELQKNNIKAAKQIITSIEKDFTLLNSSQSDYARLASLMYNTKAAFYRKSGENQEALRCLDQAILAQKLGNVDRIDMARTLLNKSVIMGQMAREDKKLYSHESAIDLAKEALEIIKNRPEGKQFVHKDQYKLGEIIIISFHNIATELICLKNEEEGYNLYKKAHDLALRVLGPRHNLTVHLKNIIQKYKQEKTGRRKFYTQDASPEDPKETCKTLNASYASKNYKKSNIAGENKKFKNFFRVYGYTKDESLNDQSVDFDMKDLSKLKKMYAPIKGTYFPEIKRRSVKDIINEGRELASKKHHIASSVTDRDKATTLKNSSGKISAKKMDLMKTEEIGRPLEEKKSGASKLQPQKQEIKKEENDQTQGKQGDNGCQLI